MIVTCLIGDPVEHSVSNYMYNYFAEKVGLNYSHVKFRVPSNNKNNLKIAIQSLRVLSIRGANITLPYKIEVMKYLDEIDKTATLIGAVNTIVNKDCKLIGYNTDGKGAISAIEQCFKKIKPEDKIVVFGAGGAARAIVFEITKRTKNITVINRSLDFYLAEKLRKDFKEINNKIKIFPLNDKNIIHTVINSDFVINATSVGMFPKSNEEIINQKIFNKICNLNGKYFFDAIFNPYKTKFLLNAEKKGGKVCSGLDMMIYQAISAFKLWVGHDLKRVNIKPIKKRLIKILQKF